MEQEEQFSGVFILRNAYMLKRYTVKYVQLLCVNARSKINYLKNQIPWDIETFTLTVVCRCSSLGPLQAQVRRRPGDSERNY